MLASATAMADVQPLRALHYDPAVAGALADVVAPPYDVIDRAQRAELLARSPFNVVAVDLPQGEPDPYAAAEQTFEEWQSKGAVVRDSRARTLGPHTGLLGTDGVARTRRGFFCRVRIEGYGPGRVRPHERTHPGPKEDRLRLTRATRANISPIFSLYSDPEQRAWDALQPATEQEPWGDVTEGQGTRHRLWRVSDPQVIAAVQAATADAELLIADGHHRYETMDAYAEELGGEGEHRYILMCLVALQDPGLTIFPTHRLVKGLDVERRTPSRTPSQRTSRSPRYRPMSWRPTPTTAAHAAGNGLHQGRRGASLPAAPEGPVDRRRGARRAHRALPPPRHWRIGDIDSQGRPGDERRGHLPLQRHVLRA